MNSDLPKALQALAGEPLLQHVIRTAQALNPAALYVVYGHGGAAVRNAFANTLAPDAVQWVLQSAQLGTGHAMLQAMPTIPDEHTVLVLYGDVPLIRATALESLVRAADAGALALLTVELVRSQGYGRVVRERGQVIAVVEDRDATAEQLAIREVNTGFMAVSAGRLRRWLSALDNDNAQREYYLTGVVGAAVRQGHPVTAVSIQDEVQVLGVNDRLQLARVESGLRQRRAEELMIAGATLADPARIDVRGEVSIGRDVFIDVNAVLIGRVRLGARVRIGPNCVIRDSSVGADTEIQANCVIEESAVSASCRIGPFARLRPGTELGPEVHIGNFVEVKKARIGAGSKVNHLSYVGDARIGSAVNVGAGTITCNYDGANKWPTEIEDGAFIGSGSMLVAPVRIGAGATIGAGSTIAHGAAEGKLTLTRAGQRTIDDWSRPQKLSAAEQARVIDESLKR
ncbi:MAG: bifunctional UDP-N-acetylglucosamine diphosphorylase/glucosamine-1-phosphate N-acetyltransferase GlmU [Steroidobacteraceae bacterium]